jgi:hypothetical protein
MDPLYTLGAQSSSRYRVPRKVQKRKDAKYR